MQRLFLLLIIGIISLPCRAATCGPTGARAGAAGTGISGYIVAWTSQCTTGANALGYDVQNMIVDISTAAGNIQVAIYSNSGWTTTAARLCLSSSQAAVSGDNTLSFTGCHLNPNLAVHFAIEASSASLRQGYSNTTANQTFYYSAQTYGTFPDPYGASSSGADGTPRMFINLTATSSCPKTLALLGAGC